MARLRIRIELNKGRRGIFLHKLGGIGEETAKFLRMLGEDLGLGESKRDWLAVNFRDGSVTFEVENAGQPTEPEACAYTLALRSVIDYVPPGRNLPASIRLATIKQYAQIAGSIDPDEHVSFGLYVNGEDDPTEWRMLSKQHAQELASYIDQPLQYEGWLQGRIHALYKGASPPYIQVRELSSGDLVKCIYKEKDYDVIVSLLHNKDAVVNIFGRVKARGSDGKIEEIRIDKAEEAPSMSEEEFERFFGCAPDMTGHMSTEEFIDKVRDGE